MSKLTVIILTFNEEIHLDRCLKSLLPITSNFIIVDSFSTDSTLTIAQEYEAEVHQRQFVNHAKQFQWALDNCSIKTEWVMRMDADEYLEEGLVREINSNLNQLDRSVHGIYLKRKVLFKGKWIKYGGFYPHTLLRIWRNGMGRIEQRWMDEHIVLKTGSTVTFQKTFVDYNLNSITWWVAKHNKYAIREMVDLLNIKYHFINEDNALRESKDSRQARIKRIIKEGIYARLSPGIRSFLYFLYRYVLKLGFLDGYYGFIFHFMQGFWYRLLVDVLVVEVENEILSQSDLTLILKEKYGVDVTDDKK